MAIIGFPNSNSVIEGPGRVKFGPLTPLLPPFLLLLILMAWPRDSQHLEGTPLGGIILRGIKKLTETSKKDSKAWILGLQREGYLFRYSISENGDRNRMGIL